MRIASPCNKNCNVDPTTHVCTGCNRTYDEIVGWNRMTSEERNVVLQRIDDQKKEASRSTPKPTPTA